MVFRRQCDNGARRFRHPVHLNKTAAEHFHAFPQESQRDRTGAVGDVFEVAVIDATRPRLADHDLQRGRDDEKLVDLVMLDEIEDAVGVEVANHDTFGAMEQCPEGPPRAADVADRHGD